MARTKGSKNKLKRWPVIGGGEVYAADIRTASKLAREKYGADAVLGKPEAVSNAVLSRAAGSAEGCDSGAGVGSNT